jgi:hypothetical protein
MVQIFGMLFGNDYEKKQLEAFCCFLLLPTANSDLIKKKDYINLLYEYKTNKYKTAMHDTLAHYINMDNPLFMSSMDDTISDKKIALSLPSVLNKIDKTLFNNYANMLNKYAETLVIADGIADITEQKNLVLINQLIYEI